MQRQLSTQAEREKQALLDEALKAREEKAGLNRELGEVQRGVLRHGRDATEMRPRCGRDAMPLRHGADREQRDASARRPSHS